jgi:hypothetical protein
VVSSQACPSSFWMVVTGTAALTRSLAKVCLLCRARHSRHSCATLLLNAGAPILTVQTVLGHTHIDTTLGYARLYDGTLAADYYAAMAQVEGRLALPEDAVAAPPSHAEMLALIDSLRGGTLNEAQTNTVRRVRIGIMALAEHAARAQSVSR